MSGQDIYEQLQIDINSNIYFQRIKVLCRIDTHHFAAHNLEVKVIDDWIHVQGKHHVKMDSHGYVARMFKRRFKLADDLEPDSVTAKVDKRGVLVILAEEKMASVDEQILRPPIRFGRQPPHDASNILEF